MTCLVATRRACFRCIEMMSRSIYSVDQVQRQLPESQAQRDQNLKRGAPRPFATEWQRVAASTLQLFCLSLMSRRHRLADVSSRLAPGRGARITAFRPESAAGDSSKCNMRSMPCGQEWLTLALCRSLINVVSQVSAKKHIHHALHPFTELTLPNPDQTWTAFQFPLPT